jgi:protoporphyrinogen oxidase
VRIAIIGAGPCGLSCARELALLGHDDWFVAERAETAGGSASSVTDPAGFTWDCGGHVVFSHFHEFDALLTEAMGSELIEHDRSSYVLVAGRWVPYPFQNNLHHLPDAIAQECLAGLRDAPGRTPSGDGDFGSWMAAVFGAGITEHFMAPYNAKVWATAPSQMSSNWIAERVSVPDRERVFENFRLGRDDRGWGPNNRFRFPAVGGTGEIYRRVAAGLGARVRFGQEVVAIDARRRELRFGTGGSARYDALVSTMPLDRLVASLADCPGEVKAAAQALEHNSVSVVGVGYESPLADERSWLYFPDLDVPFYRVTNFAKYAPSNVPGGDTSRFSSYMTETSFAPARRNPAADLEADVLDGLARTGLAPCGAAVASVHRVDLDYGYPIPTIDRDRALGVIHEWLDGQAVYSRGRFGGWRYEIGNMDHAAKMGIDIARRLVEGRPEELWRV